jgi:hypothetical protein
MPVSDSSSDDMDTDFASDDPDAAPPGPGGKPGKTTTVEKDKGRRRESIVRERGDGLTEADLGRSLHERLATHILHLPTEELEIRHAPPSLSDLNIFRDNVGDVIEYVGTSTYAFDAVLARLFLMTTDSALFLRPRRKLKSVYMARSARTLAGGQAGVWIASAYYRLVDCHWVMLVGTPSGSSIHLDCGIAMEPKERVIRLTPCRVALKHVALLRLTWQDLNTDPPFWEGGKLTCDNPTMRWRIEYPDDLRDLTRKPYDRPPPGYGPDGLPLRRQQPRDIPVPASVVPPPPVIDAPPTPPDASPTSSLLPVTEPVQRIPVESFEGYLDLMTRDTPDDQMLHEDGQGWDVRHPDVAWAVRRVVDGVQVLVLGEHIRTVTEANDTQSWDPSQFWPCRSHVIPGRIVEGVVREPTDFITGWRLTVQWLRTHPDADVLIGDTVLGDIIVGYPWHEASSNPQICAAYWERPALVRLFGGVYLSLNIDRMGNRLIIDITLVITNSIPHVTAVTPMKPGQGSIRPAVVGREWTVVSYSGEPCYVTQLPMRAFVAMMVESYTIPLACDGIQALKTDAEWIVKTIW